MNYLIFNLAQWLVAEVLTLIVVFACPTATWDIPYFTFLSYVGYSSSIDCVLTADGDGWSRVISTTGLVFVYQISVTMDYRTFYRSQFLALAALALLLGVFYPTATWKKVAWMSLFSTNYISQLDSVVAQERFKWLGVAALVSCFFTSVTSWRWVLLPTDKLGAWFGVLDWTTKILILGHVLYALLYMQVGRAYDRQTRTE